MKVLKITGFFLGILTLLVGNTFSNVLFEDDFEANSLDKSKWIGAASWKIVDNVEKIPALGNNVLDVLGGEEGLGIEEFPEDYDYYANFRSMNGLTGFIFHGQDANNIYMHQISVTGSAWTPNHTRWHRKVGGNYAAEPEPFEDGVNREQQVWYRAKFEVRGHNFKIYICDVDAGHGDMTLVGEWTDSVKAFSKGKIGIRMSGSEYAQYDNILVTTANYNFSVDYEDKLALTWGKVKIRN